MSDFGDFLYELGNLHDCTITHIEWKPDLRRMIFEIEDIYWNFEGYPEYKGPRPGTITLEDIQHVEGDINNFHTPLIISDFCVISENNNISQASVAFWSGSGGKIEIAFGRVTFPRL